MTFLRGFSARGTTVLQRSVPFLRRSSCRTCKPAIREFTYAAPRSLHFPFLPEPRP